MDSFIFKYCCNYYGSCRDKFFRKPVVLETNGGTTTVFSVGSNTSLEDIVIPEKDGYIFTGWYADPNYSSGQLTEIPKNTTTIYAKWDEVYYTIEYYLDGGVNNAQIPFLIA